jgi:hypothetical protein
VALLFGERVEARVLDGHRRLHRKRLRALHLIRREASIAGSFGKDRGADRVVVRDQRQRHQRAHAERAHVVGVDLRARGRVFDDDRLLSVQHVEEEGRLRALGVLAPPQILEV